MNILLNNRIALVHRCVKSSPNNQIPKGWAQLYLKDHNDKAVMVQIPSNLWPLPVKCSTSVSGVTLKRID